MKKPFNKTDYILWGIIAVYTGIIYATLSIVSKARKFLAEKYGSSVFDHIYWIFAVAGIIFLIYCFKKFKGKKLLGRLTILGLFCTIYAYYLSGMRYPVEKIHFLEYGLLGVLVYIAFLRHVAGWIAVIFSLNVVFWLGMGDEAIQWALPSRVGEIRDGIINLFSGALGTGLMWFIGTRENRKDSVNIFHLKMVLVSFGVTTVLTALFLFNVHGFGRVIETKDPGRIYSAFSSGGLSRINNQKKEMSHKEHEIYEDEAMRHLFQREYYFTNDYVASNGVTYKIYSQCFFENRVLEVYYKRFLNEHAKENSGPLLRHIDNEVAGKVMQNPVMWSDSLRQSVKQLAGDKNKLFSSRVKSTLIVSFKMKDLIFYCVIIFLLLGYFWFLICKTEINRGFKQQR